MNRDDISPFRATLIRPRDVFRASHESQNGSAKSPTVAHAPHHPLACQHVEIVRQPEDGRTRVTCLAIGCGHRWFELPLNVGRPLPRVQR